VNTTGYSNASTSLLTSPGYVITGASGAFSITGDYTCPNASTPVYLYAVGGDAGSGSNAVAGLLAGLGPCGNLSASTFVVINEVSTIATAYAIAGFATDATHVSSSNSTLAATGVTNAFATIANMETMSTGVALATTPAANGGNGTVPQNEINTLADILPACINTDGIVSGPVDPTPCYTLLNNATNGSTVPSDTATAAINIAHNPGINIATLYGLPTANAPFQPSLNSEPNDFTIAISYTAGGLNTCNDLAVDGSGNVWVTNGSGNSISEFGPVGNPISSSAGFATGGLAQPKMLAIDATGNVWATNTSSNSISELKPNGSAATGSPFSGGGLSNPWGVAVDAIGDIWIANNGSPSISEFSSTGAAISPAVTGYTGGGLDQPQGIAIDAGGDVWVANVIGNTVSLFVNRDGTPVTESSFYTGGLNYPDYIAIDASGHAWVENEDGGFSSGGVFVEYNAAGSVLSGTSGYSGGGLNEPDAIAIDGAGNVWAANKAASSISEFSSEGTATSSYMGYESASVSGPSGLAIDASGNVWVSNGSSGANSITEFVGVATPVVTPLVANLKSPYGQYAVNLP